MTHVLNVPGTMTILSGLCSLIQHIGIISPAYDFLGLLRICCLIKMLPDKIEQVFLHFCKGCFIWFCQLCFLSSLVQHLRTKYNTIMCFVLVLCLFFPQPQVALLTQCKSLCIYVICLPQGHLLIPHDKLRVSARNIEH